MRSREYYENKAKKKITRIFKKQIKRKYKEETKKGKFTTFTYKEIEIESAYGNLYLFSIHRELLLDCFIKALEELNTKYNISYNTDTWYFTIKSKKINKKYKECVS